MGAKMKKDAKNGYKNEKRCRKMGVKNAEKWV